MLTIRLVKPLHYGKQFSKFTDQQDEILLSRHFILLFLLKKGLEMVFAQIVKELCERAIVNRKTGVPGSPQIFGESPYSLTSNWNFQILVATW